MEAVIDLGFRSGDAGFQAEGLVWTDEGLLQGIHPRRTAVPLPDAKAGESVEVVLEAAANPWFPSSGPHRWDRSTRAGRAFYRLRRADLANLDRTVHDLVLDVEVLDGSIPRSPAGRPPPGPAFADAGAGLGRARPRRRGRERGALAGGARPRPRPPTPGRARTPRSPSATRTSTRRGCGRCGRPSASARARSRRRCGSWTTSPTIASSARKRRSGVDAGPPSRPLRPHAGGGRYRAMDPISDMWSRPT